MAIFRSECKWSEAGLASVQRWALFLFLGKKRHIEVIITKPNSRMDCSMVTQSANRAFCTKHCVAGSSLDARSEPRCILPRLARPPQARHYTSLTTNLMSGLQSKPPFPTISSTFKSCNRRHTATVNSASSGGVSDDAPSEHAPNSSDEDPIIIVEEDPKLKSKFSFENTVFYIQLTYFAVLLASISTGNPLLTRVASFANFVTAMFLTSAAFTGWSATRWFTDVRKNLATAQREKDFKSLLKYGWSAMFWLGFALWYAVPPYQKIANWTGTAGAICCLYGIALAGTSAIMVGSWSFLGPPSAPRRLVTGGPYALLRHPQALGNFLAVIGFSLSGGAVAAALAFITSFYMYAASTVPQEEKMLMKTFGVKYKHYAENVPAFSWALVVLLILEAVLIWRYGVRPLVPV
jgi:protein-S-isoprenylcysteine O-methyltransferase Ste14